MVIPLLTTAASADMRMAITPTKLAKAYADAGYFERNVRASGVMASRLRERFSANQPPCGEISGCKPGAKYAIEAA